MLKDLHQQAQKALKSRDYQQTHQCCMLILKQNPRFADAWFMLAMIAFDHGQVGKSLELLEKSVYLDNSNPDYLTQMAKGLTLSGQHPKAAETGTSGTRIAA